MAIEWVRFRKQAAERKLTGGKRTNTRSKDRQIRVLGVVRPEIDTERLARAIIRMAEELAAKKSEKTKDSDGTAA